MDITVKYLGRVEYEPTWHAMQDFTAARDESTPDELWLLEHPPVFTLGQAGKREHLLQATDIPVVPIDRGGQITYHGPGQIVIYVLVDLKRRGYGVKELVNRMEQAVIDLLAQSGVAAERKAGAPGVYVRRTTAEGGAVPAAGRCDPGAGCGELHKEVSGGTEAIPMRQVADCDGQLAKIAALGLRIKQGRSYHGLALNVDMDLAPFALINPCGYPGMPVTQMRDLGIAGNAAELGKKLLALLAQKIAG